MFLGVEYVVNGAPMFADRHAPAGATGAAADAEVCQAGGGPAVPSVTASAICATAGSVSTAACAEEFLEEDASCVAASVLCATAGPSASATTTEFKGGITPRREGSAFCITAEPEPQPSSKRAAMSCYRLHIWGNVFV